MQKVKICLSLTFLFLASVLFGQVTLSPSNASGNELVTLTFNAVGTPLSTETSIYAHAGVVTKNTTSPIGSDWTNVKGNWGKDDGIGKMTPVSGQAGKWQITFSPTLRQYFEVPQGTNIFWLALVFRNTTGTKQTSPDTFIQLNLPNYISILTPDHPITRSLLSKDKIFPFQRKLLQRPV